MREKSLDEIRPAKGGVKMARKASAQPQRQTKPQVVKNVQPPAGDLPPPTEEAARVIIENNRAKDALIEAIKGVNRLMNYKVLPENRSVKENDEERAAVTALVNAAIAMETLSPGEGLLGMATLAVRQGLSLRDAGNRLAYELAQTRREVKALCEQLEVARTGKPNG